MKRKARIQAGIDDRLVAIYARKSRITNKGDSIGVQFKQSADYAVNQLSLPEDYEFIQYEDKGLSGYYSDRPDFQRLLRDIEMGKIKAVACYKLDRISRKTSDLMRLLEYFERHDVTLLVCSNNINTQISTSKIIIQVLAIIAEFERDILTERIQDNLMELAKDGRWLGGKTPTGFSSKRVTTGSGKNKSAISFLVPIEEEKEIVLEIYRTFWETRSLLQTANLISEKYETKHGAKFTTSTIRLILRNPIYCVADEYSYNYFLEHDGNLFGEAHEFDGKHGLSAYNKTDQMKVEDEDSTFFNPKFSQLLTKKPISEWIVSVGRHEGFISSRKWLETQNMLDEIAEKYNRPHRKTNALLAGLMYCPICGKRLRVLSESNRWTNGKPRFKYACPGVRAKECTFKGVEGVTLDEFVIHSLSSLQEEHSDYYRQLLENRVASMIRTDQGEKEYQETKKAIERLNADIAAQVRNLREADDALKRFIQDDIKVLTDDLAKREADLRRIENTQSENHYLIHELNSIKKRLLSFEEFAKDAQPETLFTLVHSIVDRIYITTDGSTQKCQVYIKGCATEDYSDILGAAEYIDGKFLLPVATYMPPMCDLDKYSITDVQAFWTLLILILLWSFMFFVVVLAYVNIKEKKKQKIFQTFISDPDVVNEEKLLQVVSQQEREQIQLLALVLRDNRLRLCNLSEELRDYEEYVESWVHEAKTPLALLTMIMDNRADELPFEIQTKLDYVCNQLQEDITQMLYYARLKSSTKDYRFEELDLQSLLKDVLADYEPLLEEKHFVIKNEVKEEQVFTDRRGLQFMLGQIISNVIKYSTDNPMLTTSTQHTTREIILSITDNGSGVKSYDLPYIFQKGFTGDSANNRNKATGMGLYLTKKMADDLNLKLDVQSEYNSFFKISIRFPI